MRSGFEENLDDMMTREDTLNDKVKESLEGSSLRITDPSVIELVPKESLGEMGSSPEFTELPVVDLAPFHLISDDSGEVSSECMAAAMSLRELFQRTGFVYLVNHGVPPETMERAKLAAAWFFALPTERKMEAASKDRAKRGYSPLLTENFACLAGNRAPNDIVEKFRVGPPDYNNEDPYYHTREARAHFYPNSWPKENGTMDSEFIEAICAYYSAMESLTLKLLAAFEIALGVEAGFLSTQMDRHTSILSANYYPPVSNIAIAKGQLRVAPHTDVSLFTIVAQDEEIGGLEVNTSTSEEDSDIWLKVSHVPNALVLNIGDFLSHLTNQHWKSTVHRVSLPPPDDVQNHRHSLVYFVGPNFDCSAAKILESFDSISDQRIEEASFHSIGSTYSEWRKERVKHAMRKLRRPF